MKRVLLLCLCFCLACAFPALADEMESLSGNEAGYEIMPLNDDDGGSGDAPIFRAKCYLGTEPDRILYNDFSIFVRSSSASVYALGYGTETNVKGLCVVSTAPFTFYQRTVSYDFNGVFVSDVTSSDMESNFSSDFNLYYCSLSRSFADVGRQSYEKSGYGFAILKDCNSIDDILAAVSSGTADLPDIGGGGSGGGSSDDYFGDGGATPWKYDSFVPSPVNFKCSVKKSSGIGSIINPNSNVLYYLTWSNPEASGYYILLSAQVKIRETGELKTVWLEDTKRDVGYPATTGSYSPDWVEMEERYDLLWGTYYPVSFELRFYKIESGYVHTGNMARCILNVDSNGNYYGSTTDSIELDESWNQTVKPDDTFTSDVNGNVTNIGGSGGSGGEGEGGNSNTVQNWLDNFLSIPNVLNQFFLSLRNLMSGIGEVPALIGDMFSALPAGILTIMGIGITLVVVLRIFGR